MNDDFHGLNGVFQHQFPNISITLSFGTWEDTLECLFFLNFAICCVGKRIQFLFSGFCHWYLPFCRALLPEVSGVAYFCVVSRLSVIGVPWGRSRGDDRHGLSMWGDVVGPVLAGSDDR